MEELSILINELRMNTRAILFAVKLKDQLDLERFRQLELRLTIADDDIAAPLASRIAEIQREFDSHIEGHINRLEGR